MKEIFKSYEILKDKHIGAKAFICGAGTSLNDIIENNNYHKIYDHVVISINSNILSHEWIDADFSDRHYWVSNDSAVMYWDYWTAVKKSNIIKIIRDSWMKYQDILPKDFLMFSPRKNDKIEIQDNEGLCYTSSVPTGIDLAMQMGCKEIYLLGVDHYFLPNGKSHFWELWPKSKQPVSNQFRLPISRPAPVGMQKQVFKQNKKVYKELLNWSEKLDVKIYNCSKKSMITFYDKIDFDEIFKKKGAGVV